MSGLAKFADGNPGYPKERLAYWFIAVGNAAMTERRVKAGTWTEEAATDFMRSYLLAYNDGLIALGITPFVLDDIYPLNDEWRASFQADMPEIPAPLLPASSDAGRFIARDNLHSVRQILAKHNYPHRISASDTERGETT